MLRGTSVRVLEIPTHWVDTDLIVKSDDPCAMLLHDFISETIELLTNATTEVVVEQAAALRVIPSSNEHLLVE
ncbi:hypothetical protein ACUS6C_04155 [Pseudomonas aeruginosa]